jgi:hypothetical protein
MKELIATYLKSLNSVSVESSLFIFRGCFLFLSSSFEELSTEQVENWIRQLKSPRLDEIWARRKGMKYPSSILYFVVWHFRDKVIQEQGYVREVLEKPAIADINSQRVKKIVDQLMRQIHELSAFEGVTFVGSLIGAWMLSCPKASVLSAISSLPNSKRNEIWIKSVFPDTLSSDELKLLYRLDYWLENALKTWRAPITE